MYRLKALEKRGLGPKEAGKAKHTTCLPPFVITPLNQSEMGPYADAIKGLTPMSMLWHSATSTKDNWPVSPEIWRPGGDESRLNSNSTRSIPRFLLILGVVGLVACGLLVLPWLAPPALNETEIAVLFPSSDTTAWPDFVRGVRLAADERKLPVREDPSHHSLLVMTEPIPTRFQWHPVIGSFALQRKVRELCTRPDPPLAIVGASNTSLTRAVGNEVRQASRADWVPLLLMTSATADELIDVNPGRSFRFGFNNSYQARAVVAELDSLLATLPDEQRPVQAVVVEVVDNPFSVDLARHFERELKARLSARILADPSSTDQASHWKLRTAGRGNEGATDDERQLAQRIIDRLAQVPSARSVVVLPTDLATLHHLAVAIKQERFRRSVEDPSSPALGDIYLLTGDSIDYYDVISELPASAMPGPLLFFSHVNPIDRSIPSDPESHRPAISLNRDVAETLLSAISKLSTRPAPDQLAEILRDRTGSDGGVSFEAYERSAGGGTVVATPTPMGDRFEIQLPEEWAQSP